MRGIKFLTFILISVFMIATFTGSSYAKKKGKKKKSYYFTISDSAGNQTYKSLKAEWNWKLKDARTYVLTIKLNNRSEYDMVSFKLKVYTTVAGEYRELWDYKRFYIPPNKTDQFVIDDLPNVDYDDVKVKIQNYKAEEE